ncbi:MAG: Carboxy-terminal-processing protease [Pseudomonadota bacterium]|jgi:carboxyl-terminal processing protease
MKKRFKNFSLISIGVIFGILVSINLSVFADKNEEAKKLPVEDLRIFAEVFGKIKADYVEEVADKKLLTEALNGMLAGLDPHSTFLDEDHFKEMQQGTAGEFGGLGIEVGMEDGFVKVISPIEDTPAFKAGLQSGDLIIKLDDKSVKGMTLNDAVKLMRGKPGSTINVQILRKGKDTPFDVKITRAQIKSQSVKAKLIQEDYGYLRVTQFQERTGEDVAKSINKLFAENKKPLNGIILDMRNNPGGLLNAAVAVSAAFIPEGELVVYTEGRAKDSKMHLTAIPENFIRDPKGNNYINKLPPEIKKTPMVVLVNNGSASASEIVAGALQDHKRALIVGTKSFGKGSVQSILPMNNGTAIKLTTARYFTPKGRSIQAKGIDPDIIVEDGFSGLMSREADLNNRLSNPEENKQDKSESTESKANEKNNTSESSKSDDGAEALKNFKPVEFGTEDDKQFQEALNILKGIDMYKTIK